LRSATPFGTLSSVPSTYGTLIELRHVRVHHVNLLVDHIVGRDRHVGTERVWPLEVVLEIHETGVLRSAGVSGVMFGTTTGRGYDIVGWSSKTIAEAESGRLAMRGSRVRHRESVS
jgi:hypothetical protein